jgi:hypothetical protein
MLATNHSKETYGGDSDESDHLIPVHAKTQNDSNRKKKVAALVITVRCCYPVK